MSRFPLPLELSVVIWLIENPPANLIIYKCVHSSHFVRMYMYHVILLPLVISVRYFDFVNSFPSVYISLNNVKRN